MGKDMDNDKNKDKDTDAETDTETEDMDIDAMNKGWYKFERKTVDTGLL